MKDNLAVQVRDGHIALYSADSDGFKKDLLVQWDDDTIVKSDLNTLTLSGGYGGTGNVQTRGFCKFYSKKGTPILGAQRKTVMRRGDEMGMRTSENVDFRKNGTSNEGRRRRPDHD